ncbi:MAG TPA: hypothetical protein VE575_16280 [Acidimicrobiales bacterium]|jgi:hypothetical protein|nr:hypothetical protein [Acidimicrobiales bacterium]
MPAIDEPARHDLYVGLEELLGSKRAGTLMSMLPTVDWTQVATKDDLRQLEERIEARMDARFARADARVSDLETRMEARFAHVDARFDTFEHRLESRFDRKIQELTRTLLLGMVGAMFTMTSLFLGVIALVV